MVLSFSCASDAGCTSASICELQSRQGLGTASAAPAGTPPGVDAATLAHIQGVAAAAGLTSIGTSAPTATAAAAAGAGNDAMTAAGGRVARHAQH